MDPTHLHVYQCSLCQTIATTTVKTEHPPMQCIYCRRFMAYQWSQEIVTQAEKDIASAGVMFNPWTPRRSPKRTCDTCKAHLFPDELIHVEGLGKFCSQQCADEESHKHAALMERLSELYARMPWLDPGRKTKESV